MDGVSSASAILALAGVFLNLCESTRRCLKTLRHARKEVKCVVREASEFSSLLSCLHKTLVGLPADLSKSIEQWTAETSTSANAETLVKDIQDFMCGVQPLMRTKNTTKVSRNWARIQWYFQKHKVLLLITSLQSSKSSLTWLTTIINLQVTLTQKAASDSHDAALEEYIAFLKQQVRSSRSIAKLALREYKRLLLQTGKAERSNTTEQIISGLEEKMNEQLAIEASLEHELPRSRRSSANSTGSTGSTYPSSLTYSSSGTGLVPSIPSGLDQPPSSPSQSEVSARPAASRIATWIGPDGQWNFSEFGGSEGTDASSYEQIEAYSCGEVNVVEKDPNSDPNQELKYRCWKCLRPLQPE